MTKDIMIDLTSRPRKRYNINRCYKCPGHEKEGNPIMPDDKDAYYKKSNNQWVCGTCVREDLRKSLSLFGGPVAMSK